MSSQVLDVKEERAVLSGPGSQDWLPRLMKKDAGPSAHLPPVQAPGPTSLGCGGRAPQPHTPVSAQPQLRIDPVLTATLKEQSMTKPQKTP